MGRRGWWEGLGEQEQRAGEWGDRSWKVKVDMGKAVESLMQGCLDLAPN